jgi:predicted nucleic acid-binding protein
MDKEYLLDSDVIIGYLAGKIPVSGMKTVSAIVDQIPRISVISQIEILRFNDTPDNETVLLNFVNSSLIYSLSAEAVQRTIEICKQNKIKLPDAIIAATALIENLILVTRNIDDFKDISGLELLNPWLS